MEDTTLKQPTMVSRLPKFGSRATPAAGPLTNGSAHNASSGWAKGVPVEKQNSIIKVPAPFLIKGRKGREDYREKAPDSGEEARIALRSQQQPRSTVTVRQIKKPSATLVGKTQRCIPTVPSTIPKTITQTIKTNSRNTVPKQPPSVQPLCSKVGANAINLSQGSSSSSQGRLQSSLSQSSDSLKSVSVENVVRSQSFSYLKRPTAAINPPLTRSFSFNRATELAKELPRPLSQSPIARSPVTQASRVLDCVAKPAIATCTISSMPPTTIKKSLLPNLSDGKPSSLSYKLTRPSLIKQPRPVMPGKVQGKIEFTERDRSSREKPTFISEPSRNSAETTPEETFSAKETDNNQGQSLEILEDMSLSSTSSLERNDVSEEYMDDFDDLGNGGGILLMPVYEDKNDQRGLFKEDNTQDRSSVTSLHNFMSETVDWAEIGLTGNREVAEASHHCGTRGLSTERDLPHGSSLELSPSDSSGGTYMWDEEVLEPIGRTTQICGSFDSNLNSMDILNNLDNLDSCDLEEDDLMLDVDLPEDVSLHSDVDISAHYDHSASNYWPWRKRQQCKGQAGQLHCDKSRGGVLEPFDNDHTLGSSRRGSGQSSLDELMLKHMAQDCSSVKEQLFHLRTLLQIEDDGSVHEHEQIVSSPSSEETSYQQVDELLKEVQKLREEVKGKDALISKLTQQLLAPVKVTPCLCQQVQLQRQDHQDKSTQTPWRAQNPQILQPSQPSASEQKKLARPSCQALSEAPSKHVDTQPGDGPVKPQSCTVVLPVSGTRNSTLPSAVPTTAPAISTTAASLSPSTLNSNKLILLLNTHLHVDDSHSPRAHVSNHIQLKKANQQPGDLHTLSRDRKAPVLIKPRGAEQVGLGRGLRNAFGLSGPPRTRHLPPPSCGLPCISSASQSNLSPSTHSLSTRMILGPKGEEINSVQAEDLSFTSRLPKPKSH